MSSVALVLLATVLKGCVAFDVKEIAANGFRKVVGSYIDGKRAIAQLEVYMIVVIVLSIVVVLQFIVIGYLVKKLLTQMKYAKTTPKEIMLSTLSYPPHPTLQNYK